MTEKFIRENAIFADFFRVEGTVRQYGPSNAISVVPEGQEVVGFTFALWAENAKPPCQFDFIGGEPMISDWRCGYLGIHDALEAGGREEPFRIVTVSGNINGGRAAARRVLATIKLETVLPAFTEAALKAAVVAAGLEREFNKLSLVDFARLAWSYSRPFIGRGGNFCAPHPSITAWAAAASHAANAVRFSSARDWSRALDQLHMAVVENYGLKGVLEETLLSLLADESSTTSS